jgi:hypothetical protein
MSLVPFPIFAPKNGLVTSKKPVFLPDDAWQVLENAYTWRERTKKREGIQFLGRLRRALSAQALGNLDGSGNFTGNIRAILSLETNSEIDVGSLTLSDGTNTYTDQSNGLLVGVASGTGSINYSSTALKISGGAAGGALTATFNYFPSLPVMGIVLREIASIDDEQTIWFDTKYAYVWAGGSATNEFTEFLPLTATTWSGTNSDFFSYYNYRGAAPQDRLLFVTNFVNNVSNPLRYTDGNTWTSFTPLVTSTQSIFQARVIVAYYGRLLLMNTWEGPTASGPGGAANIYNRCRFSQLGSPIDVDAFRTDIFGRGGLLDAPVNEAIVGATFVKNTLIVDFERSTWQLRYVGEYGLPFVWDRVSADFGAESTFSGVLFDNHRLAVGDKGITAGNAIGVDRIDLDIPDQIFQFKNSNDGPKRVFGIRDFQRELVFWNYPDSQTQASPDTDVDLIFPNKVLVYNYRNQTWAIFRDSITAFGTFQSTDNITWDNTNILWDDESITWDDFDSQSLFPFITSGNQQGYVHLYGYVTPDQQSITIHNIDLTTTPIRVTSANHNLQPDEIIYITDLKFLNSSQTSIVSTDLNNKTYSVSIIDENTLGLYKWNTTSQRYENNFSFTPATTSVYTGGGQITLLPRLSAKTKDINIFQSKGMLTKLSYIDFLMEPTTTSAITVELNINAGTAVKGNVSTGQKNLSAQLTTPFYTEGSGYAWFRFYATLSAQYFNINITYDDDLMNTYLTHAQKMTLLSLNAWCRPGGRNPF